METSDPKIMTIEISLSGKITLIFEVADGKTKSISEDQWKLEEIVKSLPAILERKQFDFFKIFSVCSFSGSDIKVYINVGDRVFCYLIDSVSGRYKGTC